MTKITSASKKMLSLFLAVLMLCSGIAVSASAEEATTVEVNQITLGADNCKFINDEYGKKIVVNNAKTTVKGSDVEYDVAFTATLKDSNPASTLPSTQDTEKNTTVFQLPVSAANVTYVISAKITVDGKDYAAAKDYEIKIKNAQQAPAAPVPVKITSASVELKSVVGCEYMLNDGEWQASPKFTGLKAKTKYTVSQRYKETETAYASDSVSVSVTTLKAADADRAPTPVLVDKTQTTITVAVVVDGKTLSGYEFSKAGYRKFKMKTVVGTDDYASLAETVSRRAAEYEKYALLAEHGQASDNYFGQKPDLLLMDGGQLQAEAACHVLERLGLTVPVLGMVKDDRHRTRALVTADGREIGIQTPPALFALIGRVQEEVHRFAIAYHHQKHTKSAYRSQLDGIPGVGEARKKLLLQRFGTVKAVRAADLPQLEEVLPKPAARAVYDHFHKETTP